MKQIAVPLSRWALKWMADKGMELVNSQLGLDTVPMEDIQTFNSQTTTFLEGYATCLSDLLQLTTNGGPLANRDEGRLNLKTLASIMHTWLYLCSHAVSTRTDQKIAKG